MIRNSCRRKVIHCQLGSMFFAVAQNSRAVVVIHGPASCGQMVYHGIYRKEGRVHALSEVRQLFVTSIADSHVVFGGEQRLRDCLRDVISTVRPEYVAVINSCISGLIGDDVSACCRDVEDDMQTPIILCDGNGFLYDQARDPVLNTAMVLAEKFTYPFQRQDKDSQAAVLLGAHLTQGSGEITELARIFRGIGFHRVYFPPIHMGKQDFREMASVSAAVAYWPVPSKQAYAESCTKDFARRMGIPYFTGLLPEGIERTGSYILQMSKVLNREEEGFGFWRQETERYYQCVRKCMGILKGVTYTFGIGLPLRYYDPLPVIHLLQQVGMVLKDIVLYSDLTEGEAQIQRQYIWSHINVECMREKDSMEWKGQVLIENFVRRTEIPQFCIFYRRIGVGGAVYFLERLVGLVSMGYGVIYER